MSAKNTFTSSLFNRILDFAKEKAREKEVENRTETLDIILAQTLLSTVKEDAFYRVREIRDAIASCFDEPQKWLTTRWVGNALRRLGFTEKRRIGTGYEYFLKLSQVQDLAERLGVEPSKSSSPSKFTYSLSSPNTSIPEIYAELRKQLTEPFYDHRAISLIAQFRKCDLEDAKKVWQIFIDEGKVFQNSFGLWEWVK